MALYNKVAHQKYLMFLECARRVTDKKVADPHKDTTIILNELLADELWLNQVSISPPPPPPPTSISTHSYIAFLFQALQGGEEYLGGD